MLDPTDDMDIFDPFPGGGPGLETVILYRRTGQSTFDFGTPAHALRREVVHSELPGRVRLPKSDLVWHLKVKDAGPLAPNEGDVIEDAAGVRHVVAHPIRTSTLGTRYRVPTVEEVA